METVNRSETEATPTSIAGLDQTVLSLSDLVAEIDNETAMPFDTEGDKDELSHIASSSQSSLQHQYILLALENTLFALPLSRALEVGHRPDITPLPNLPNWVLGISNVRGEIISFINLKAFFGISSTGTKVERRFLIIHNQDTKVGITVDRIMGILSLEQIDADLQNSPYREGEIAKYILGVAVSGGSLTNILDVDKLLSASRITGLKDT